MRKWIFSTGIALFSFLASSLSAICGEDLEFDVAAGYRQDHFSWALGHPQVFESKLTWECLQIAEVAGTFKCNTLLGYLRANANYGQIFSGKNRDSDYLNVGSGSGSNDMFEFSRSRSDANRGHVSDLSIGYGYTIVSYFNAVRVTPLVGYSQHEQHLHMHNGRQLIDFLIEDGQLVSGPLGSFDGLNSTYKARWNGFWGGLDVAFDYNPCFTAFGSIEYHWRTKYHGKGHWNLRSDIDGFTHTAYGYGVITNGGFLWKLTELFSVGISGGYLNFKTHSGEDKTHIVRGSGSRSGRTHLHYVNWHSFNVMAMLSAQF